MAVSHKFWVNSSDDVLYFFVTAEISLIKSKKKGKNSRRKTKWCEWEQKNPLQEISEKENKEWMKNRLRMIEEIQLIEEQIENLCNKRCYRAETVLVASIEPRYKCDNQNIMALIKIATM